MKMCFRNRATQANNALALEPLLKCFYGFICFTLMGINASLAASAPLKPFHAEYTAYKWDDDVGTAELKLEPLDGNRYSLTYSSDVSKFFLSDKRYEHSIFKVEEGEMVPEQYYYSRSGTGPDKKLKVRFQTSPDQHIVIDESRTLPWQGETDNQLYRIDLPQKLAEGEQTFEYDFINYRGESRTYRIKVVGEEHLTLPYGALDTVKVKIMRKSNDRETFAWFAPKLDYALVRLQQFKDGDEQGEIKLSRYTHL